ncbi:hypothetical protein AVEN_257257-1 [Araneus ventricosus]|uniref:Uncharacterized protein n=1 Tax=Araneus ventricosus TaxID=182803 RepID=A0A4Y2HBI6_ARAVE|nr:hypothetical protein AVEN_257257-1 [Araneus ventricosus]
MLFTVDDCVGGSDHGNVLFQEDRSPVHSATTERKDRRIHHMVIAHRTASAAEIISTVGTRVTRRIITNRLLKEWIQSRRLILFMPLTPNHRHLRLQRSRTKAHWREE